MCAHSLYYDVTYTYCVLVHYPLVHIINSVLPTFYSLVNMYKELEADIEGFKRPDHGCLIGWAKQGKSLLYT